MWPWPGRPKRDLPVVDYNEDSDEDEFRSPLPRVPTHTRAGSPVELAVPHLNDNVDEELAEVNKTLLNISHTPLFRKKDHSSSSSDSGEEVVEGLIVGEGETEVEMPDDDNVTVDFEDENGKDGEKAIEYSRTLKIDMDQTEIEFWFTQIENEMFTCGIKSQWMKRCVLVKNLPAKVQADVKSLLLLKQSAAPVDIYK